MKKPLSLTISILRDASYYLNEALILRLVVAGERFQTAMGRRVPIIIGLVCGLGLTGAVSAACADALATPSMAATLAANPSPTAYDIAALGKVYVTGQATFLGMTQTSRSASPYSGNSASLLDVGNGQIELQTTTGPVQFYVQLGAYTMPTLGAPYVSVGRTTTQTFGPAPVAYLKLAPTPDVSIQLGALPTLIGAEYTFTFQNMNIERGLLWNQEPATSRGVQINYSHGPVLVSASLNDGFYAGHYSWASGLASYAIDAASTLVVAGGASVTPVRTSSYVTPLAQNNGGLVNLIYSYSKGPLSINPYLQFTRVNADPALGLMTSASTSSGAVLAKYSFTPEFSLAGRTEYIRSASGGCTTSAFCDPTTVLFGARSAAWSYTLTSTYQKGRYFARAEVSSTRISALSAGDGFGLSGRNAGQARALIECGFLL
jgi:hypothetical protein